MSSERPGHPKPRVDILILNWNGWRDTIECLESVLQLHHAPIRVIVCDNGSSDDSLDRIRQWAREGAAPSVAKSPLRSPVRGRPVPIRLVEYDRRAAEAGGDAAAADATLVLIAAGDNVGFAGGNNIGLRFLLASDSTGLVCFLNNDMVVAPESLSRMVSTLESDPSIGCVGPTLLEYHAPDVVQAAAGGMFVEWQGLPRPHSSTGEPKGSWAERHPDRLDFIGMGCMLLSVDTVRRVGLIDERFFLYCEDIDYSLRLRSAGLRLALAADADVWHKGGASSVHGSSFHDYQMVRSSLLLVRKLNPGLLPAAVVYSLARCALPKLARGQWGRFSATMRAYLHAFAPQGRQVTRPPPPSKLAAEAGE
jgi:GT2 family glycosyltransferase